MKLNNTLIIAIFVLPLLLLFYLNSTTKSMATTSIQNQPQIIKFSSGMCGECKRTDRELKPLYKKYKNEIVIEEISTDIRNSYNNKKINKYRINVVPTIILIKKDNSIYKKFEGFCDYNTMETCIKELLK